MSVVGQKSAQRRLMALDEQQRLLEAGIQLPAIGAMSGSGGGIHTPRSQLTVTIVDMVSTGGAPSPVSERSDLAEGSTVSTALVGDGDTKEEGKIFFYIIF